MSRQQDLDLEDIHYFDDIRQILKEPAANWLGRMLNSAFAFVIAYILIQFLYNGVTWSAAKVLGITGSFGYSIFDLNRDPQLYSQKRVLFIFLAGPIFKLVFSIFSWQMFQGTRKVKNLANMFWFWSAFIGLTGFFTQFAFGAFRNNYEILDTKAGLETYVGFAVISAWQDIPVTGGYFLVAVGALFCILTGLIFVRPFLSLSHSFKLANNFYGRRTLYMYLIMMPFLLASVILLIVSFPNHMIALGINLAGMGLTILIGFLVLHNYKGVVQIRRNNLLNKVSVVGLIIVIVAAALALIFRT